MDEPGLFEALGAKFRAWKITTVVDAEIAVLNARRRYAEALLSTEGAERRVALQRLSFQQGFDVAHLALAHEASVERHYQALQAQAARRATPVLTPPARPVLQAGPPPRRLERPVALPAHASRYDNGVPEPWDGGSDEVIDVEWAAEWEDDPFAPGPAGRQNRW